MKKIKYYGLYAIVLIGVFFLLGCERKESVFITKAEDNVIYQTEGVMTDASQLTKQENDASESDKTQTEADADREGKELRMLLVHICGAVAMPGVYELAGDARFYHAVEAAGGFAMDADTEYLNMAELLSDGIKIYVPTKEESARLRAEGKDMLTAKSTLHNNEERENGDKRIDLNTAGISELCTLPGIGEAKAQSILSYREKVGRYQSIEEIMNVEGIKEGLFEKIKDSIKVS